LSEFVEIPASAREPKPLFAELPEFQLVREVRDWVLNNPPYLWRGHTHTTPSKTEPVEFVGAFEMPQGIETPCPCCTPNHTKFRLGIIGWFPDTKFVRLMGRHCFKRLNPEGYRLAVERLQERQGTASTIAYLTANLHKKTQAKKAAESAIDIAQHLDDLQYQLGERVRLKLGIDLWQAVRDGGQLKLVTETARGAFNTHYATVSGYRLVDPARKQLVPSINTAISALDAIPYFDIASGSDADRAKAARFFGKGLGLLREVFADMDDLKQFVSVPTTATIRNWSAQETAPAKIYMRREGLSIFIGDSKEGAQEIKLKPILDLPLPSLPDIAVTG
jgi:hypothetical protein